MTWFYTSLPIIYAIIAGLITLAIPVLILSRVTRAVGKSVKKTHRAIRY